VTFTISSENNYEPNFDEINENIAKKAKIIFLNYPNNPTGATVDKRFFEKAGSFCKKYNIILCHDAAYSEVVFDDYKAPSIFEVLDIKDCGVEFHTFSKTFCMPGWRVGFAVGNKEIISALLEVKKVMSSGNFAAIEAAAKEALEGPKDEVDRNNSVYKERMDFVIEKLLSFKINVKPPRGGFYVWFPIENLRDSLAFVKKVIVETGVVLFPGIGYGQNGEGHIRIAVVHDIPKLKEAFCRLEPYLKSQKRH
jgi:LL-diaminopimelate aminotransferase